MQYGNVPPARDCTCFLIWASAHTAFDHECDVLMVAAGEILYLSPIVDLRRCSSRCEGDVEDCASVTATPKRRNPSFIKDGEVNPVCHLDYGYTSAE